MVPPFISYIAFNRLGLTAKNLPAILRSTEDFEMHIIDCNSKDGTWEYIMSLGDSRIKTKERFELNHGRTYALNMHLLKRHPEQYFFAVDNGVHIETEGWISKFLRIFTAFPEVGLLGVMPDGKALPPVIKRLSGNLSYQELSDNASDVRKNCIPGHCMCLRPQLIKELGYFSEENYFGDIELTHRVCNYTPFKAGFMTDVHIELSPPLPCTQCTYFASCKLDKVKNTCFTMYDKFNKSEEFLEKNQWRFDETMRDMQSGARSAYCASLLDVVSTQQHIYNKDWAMANLMYFVRNGN